MRMSDTWVCVADGNRARFYHCDGPGRDLEPVMDFGIPSQCGGFCQRLACQLNRAASQDLFAHLVLVGPEETVQQVQLNLSEPTRRRVVGQVRRNLQRVSTRELRCHVLDYLPRDPFDRVH